uniref:early nodulin-75-like n=1 Tax=Oncorhynchus gorbuscha TaxID=8017 RepID=UPI001EAF5FCD|nr:early nodulin-75-like [Oncorhynchus gorbuscha]
MDLLSHQTAPLHGLHRTKLPDDYTPTPSHQGHKNTSPDDIPTRQPYSTSYLIPPHSRTSGIPRRTTSDLPPRSPPPLLAPLLPPPTEHHHPTPPPRRPSRNTDTPKNNPSYRDRPPEHQPSGNGNRHGGLKHRSYPYARHPSTPPRPTDTPKHHAHRDGDHTPRPFIRSTHLKPFSRHSTSRTQPADQMELSTPPQSTPSTTQLHRTVHPTRSTTPRRTGSPADQQTSKGTTPNHQVNLVSPTNNKMEEHYTTGAPPIPPNLNTTVTLQAD